MAVLENMPIQAIETVYKGYRFRSRLEARWAVFFETLGVEFNYEAEGFRLGTIDYLPDFYLPSIPAFFEVKGRELNADDELKVSQLAIRSGYPVYVWVGDIPEPCDDWLSCGFDDSKVGLNMLAYFKEGMDWGNAFFACKKCGAFNAQYQSEGWGRVCSCYLDRGGWDAYATETCASVLATAYAAARSARFEHGERG